MSQPLILWILASVIVGLICAITLGNFWRQRRPDKKPYTWGCFYGGHLLCYWSLCFVYPVEPEKEGIYIYYWGMTACGLGVLLRREAAWLLSTFSTINPILWIINFAYFDERKAEMTAERQAREDAEKSAHAQRKAKGAPKVTAKHATLCALLAAALPLATHWSPWQSLSVPAFLGTWFGTSLSLWGLSGIAIMLSRRETAAKNWAACMVILAAINW